VFAQALNDGIRVSFTGGKLEFQREFVFHDLATISQACIGVVGIG
jgi:hypothetical protein